MSAERIFPSPLASYDPADLLDALATGIVVLDSQLCVVYANVAAQNLLAMSFNQARGRPFSDLFSESNGMIATLKRARDTGDTYSEREVSVRPAATPRETRVLDITMTPLDGMTGTQLLLELSDETQRTRLTRESELRARLDGSRMMTRQLAHEIRNPLGGLRGAAQLLERELGTPSLREYTQVIIGEADRLQSLVNRLLTPHRLPQFRPLNVHEVLVRVKGIVQAEFPQIPVVCDFDISLPEIDADPGQLTQATLNVVRNAAQSLAGATADPRIVVSTRVARNAMLGRKFHRLAVAIAIEDNGPGIPDGLREKIFYPLVSGREGGSGLGLTIAQTFVAQHGGTIDCESRPGRTVFTILLPLDPRGAH